MIFGRHRRTSCSVDQIMKGRSDIHCDTACLYSVMQPSQLTVVPKTSNILRTSSKELELLTAHYTTKSCIFLHTHTHTHTVCTEREREKFTLSEKNGDSKVNKERNYNPISTFNCRILIKLSAVSTV